MGFTGRRQTRAECLGEAYLARSFLQSNTPPKKPRGITGPYCPRTNCMRFFLARVHTGGQTQAACRTIRISPDVHASFRAPAGEFMDKNETHVSSFGSASRGVTRSDLWSMLWRWDLSVDLRQDQCRQTSNATGRGDGVRDRKIGTLDAIGDASRGASSARSSREQALPYTFTPGMMQCTVTLDGRSMSAW